MWYARYCSPHLAAAQTTSPSVDHHADKVETRIGTLEFKDGMPSQDTLDKVYDHLDFTHAFEAFVNSIQGVSMHAMHKGFLDVGVKDNEVLIFSELMDAKSLFLTANADTIYIVGFLDLTKGPMVFETPPKFSAPSTTTGSAGSSTLECRVPIAARAAIPDPAARSTTVRCRRAGSSSPAPGPLRHLVRPVVPGEP